MLVVSFVSGIFTSGKSPLFMVRLPSEISPEKMLARVITRKIEMTIKRASFPAI